MASPFQTTRFAQLQAQGPETRGSEASLPSKLPAEALEMLSALSKGNDFSALDKVLKHLPSANAEEKVTIAARFVRHDLKLADSPDHLEHLGHLYEAVSDVVVSDSKVGKALIKGLFNYGVGYLTPGTRGEGLSHVIDALETASRKHGAPENGESFKENEAKLAEMCELTGTAVEKFKAISGLGPEDPVSPDAGHKLIKTMRSTAAAQKMHNFALIRQAPGMTLPSPHITSVLDLMNEMKEEDEAALKFTLANELVQQFDKLELDNQAQFISDLKALLEPQQDQVPVAALIKQLEKLGTEPTLG